MKLNESRKSFRGVNIQKISKVEKSFRSTKLKMPMSEVILSTTTATAKCYVCCIKFDNADVLNFHIKTVHLNMFVCQRYKLKTKN